MHLFRRLCATALLWITGPALAADVADTAPGAAAKPVVDAAPGAEARPAVDAKAAADAKPAVAAKAVADAKPVVTADGAAARQALAIVEKFHKALHDGDQSAALELLAPQLRVYESGHVEASRDEYAASHLPADIAFLQTARVTLKSRHAWSAGDSAWVLSESQTDTERKGRPVSQASLETLLLVKTAQGWRIAHIHWSSRELKETATQD
jgi:limonene-1,2-epoxide hydrolase